MEQIYVTGHRNPDTDSIVAAMAYAALRNALGDRQYTAARLGQLSDETQRVLEKFGFQPPQLITSMHTQIKDLDFERPPILSGAVTVGRAWSLMQEGGHSSLPVANEDGTLFGMLSREDVASYNMALGTLGVLDEVPLFNVLSVLEGKILNEAGENTDTVSGELSIALPQQNENLLFNSCDTIVLCGHQPDMIRRALEMNVSCLILCQAELPEEFRSLPTRTCIISTPYDAYRAARLIFQSVSVRRICRTESLLSFHLEDRVDEVKDQAGGAGGSQRSIPVRSGSGRGGDPGDHRPPPSGGYPDRLPHLCPQRACGLYQYHYRQHVPGPGTDALGCHGRHDGRSHHFRYGHVQVPHLH